MEEIQAKPYSTNKFVSFFQHIWRWWLGVWHSFSDAHPKFSSLLYKVAFFFIFSMAVTVWQFIIMTFLPYAFTSLNNIPFAWPRVELPFKDATGNALYFGIFNEPVQLLAKDGTIFQAYTAADVAAKIDVGYTLRPGGLGNFIAFEIAVFTAQCINFPLQRNITYKSKGNPYFQALMYFVGWVGVSILTNAIWGIANPLLLSWNVNDVVIGLLKTVLTGGVSMVIFFFIFLLIFPNLEKSAQNAEKRDEKAHASDISSEKKEAIHAKAVELRKKANLENARLASISAASTYNAKAIDYLSLKDKIALLEKDNPKGVDIEKEKELLEKKYNLALEAKHKAEEKKNEYDALVAPATK